jgi:large subunit ribosomal protein L10
LKAPKGRFYIMNDTTPKKSANRLKKEDIVAKLSEKADKSEGIVFANYQGLTHQQLESLRKSLKKLNAEFVTAKNSLFLLALNQKVNEEAKEQFKNPTGAIFLYGDIVDPLKTLSKMVKELSLPKIKFGLLNGKQITDAEVLKLANLPPLPVLRAQLLGNMMGPVSGLHRALSWNIQRLVMTLSAIEKTKQG